LRGNQVLGERIHTQNSALFGGILPTIAMDFHRENIERIVTESLKEANVTVDELDAIAVTNRPGLKMSLLIGLRYAKHLARKHQKPLIPIHHMEAHALTARMENDVKFPFLCLLISGGHSLLAFVEDFDKFKLLGESLDDAPGECFDKIARELKLRNLPNYENKNGGQSIEEVARECKNPTNKYKFPLMLARYRDCQFSFAGMKNVAKRYIHHEEKALELDADSVIPDYPDFCANFLGGVARHICNRTQRAMEFCERKEMFKGVEHKKLVISGGVACNDFIFTALSQLCEQFNFTAVRPSKKLCTDNGIMIAWNGIERFTQNRGIYSHKNIDEIETYPKCQLGESLIDTLKCESIHCHWAKIPILKHFSRPGK
jgi:N6-L-threonylcarbamoyladenine synthase